MKRIFLLSLILFSIQATAQRKAMFIIVDGIPADVIEKVNTPVLDEIAKRGGYTRGHIGGEKGGYSESPTISAVGYNHVLTGVWSNKHNVWDNDIKAPNYHYWNIFRIAKNHNPQITTGIFSSWTDNRTKLIGEGLPEAGNLKIDIVYDGYELDTVRFPYTKDRTYISKIDDIVAREAAHSIETTAPDLSWVYLEFTDDMGHLFGDSPQFYEAVEKADAQIGLIWNAVKEREEKYHEEWMIVITTDHGRGAETGKNHGGQTDRERTIWITTNLAPLNPGFYSNPAAVDIMPSMLRFMSIPLQTSLLQEIDGVPFYGKVSVSDLKASINKNQLTLQWNVIDKKGDAEILLATTNHFKEGGHDNYRFIGKSRVKHGKFTTDISKYPSPDGFYKILVRGRHNQVNTWIVNK
jgi:predicted AlkP superfamily pyrophosphatase or phosphodiesterase